ncbi:hypothetical protein [Streptomyces sp. NBC_00557]|uniref:hypothetical protein n=1 Tax=Streptomyces sp. NBC_00557 TaxID=2975776 RepID=UPI002E811C07|nr:hypothetical protein [Streptomyces sp. NBC_00557]WUC36393.1 hypothetical protein OG956_20290 [Streptomyces sp. NBC_00557]
MEMKCNQPTPAGATFAANAFDGQIGKEVPVNIPGKDQTTGRILAARVADDGQSVELTLDVDVQLPSYGAASFGLS